MTKHVTAAVAAEKKLRQFDEIDAMSPGLRACVHEFGAPIVTACATQGVTTPGGIRALVHEIWNGARSADQHRPRGPLPELDWLLMQSGSAVTADRLLRILWQSGLCILPRDPTFGMVEASMRTTERFGFLTKDRKHRERLRDAILAGVQHFWPQLFVS